MTMKKKLFTIALALCMVLTMVPGGVSRSEAAWAETHAPTIVKVGGKDMKGDAVTYYKNDGTNGSANDCNAMYNPSENTLTLKGFAYNGNEMGIYANGDLKIAVVGKNTITSTGYGIWTTGNLTISGTSKNEDKLKVTSSGSDAIFAMDNVGMGYAESIIISNVDIEASTEADLHVGIGAPNTVTITDSHVVSTGKAHGIQGGYFDEDESEGGNGNRGNINITGSYVKAEAKSTVTDAQALKGDVTVKSGGYSKNTRNLVEMKDVHEHYLCGMDCKAIGDHQTEASKITFNQKIWMDDTTLKIGDTAWTKATYGGGSVYKLSAGSYYLDDDIALDACILIESGAVNICLNGHTITETDSETIKVGKDETSNAEFTLTDCKTGNAQGKITRQSVNSGRGVFVSKNSKFNMYGGSIVNHKYEKNNNGGAGVSAMGTFNMYGGSISNNSAKGDNMYGGGVFTGGTFNMYGGSITGNTASSGGGGVIVNISAKTKDVGTFTVSGNVNITDNTTNGQPDNVYLEKSKDGKQLASITIGSTLNAQKKIGVRTAIKPTEDNPIVIATGVKSSDASHFVSDDSNYVVVYENDRKLVLKEKSALPHKHCICGETHQNIGDHTADTQTEFKEWKSTTTLPTEAGNYYLTDNVTLAAVWEVPKVANMTLCMNGYDISVSDQTKFNLSTKDSAIHIDSNRCLTLTDCNKKSNIKYTGKTNCYGIWLEEGATANIYNVTVTGFDSISQISTGIVNNGTVNMYNGNICNNKKISEEKGYGVHSVRNESTGTFHMYGGTITGNDTGVYNLGTVKLSGNVIIKDNNVNLVNAKDHSGEGTIILENLGTEASIGVALESSPTKGNPVVIVSNGAKAADAAKFFVDNDANKEYEIFLSDAAKGALSVRVTGDTSSASGSSSSGTSSGGSGGGASVSTPTPAAPEVITVKEETKDNSISKPGTETGTTTTTKTTVKDTTTATTKNEQGQDVSKTTASVSKDLGDKLLDQAVSNNSDTIEITVKPKDANSGGNAGSGAAGSVKSTEVELPKATVDVIAKDTNADLVIKTDNGELVLDNKTLETISDAAKGDTVTIEVNENTQLKETQKPAEKIVGKSGSLFNFVAKIGERRLHQFEGGKAYVTLPMPDRLKGKDVLVIYIDDNGLCKILNHSVEKIGADDYVRFMTTHFSTFAVVEKDEAEQLIKEQNAAHVKELIQHAKFRVTTTKTSKQNVKAQVTAKTSKTLISDIKSLGYTVKYQFYRSTKKTAGYKAVKTKTTNTYVNTKGTKGTKYYYKTRVLVYDGKTLVAKSTRKQCSWGTRVWSK